MPKMVPSFLLFWVGLELCIWSLWDLRPHRSAALPAQNPFGAVGDTTAYRRRPGFDRLECVGHTIPRYECVQTPVVASMSFWGVPHGLRRYC